MVNTTKFLTKSLTDLDVHKFKSHRHQHYFSQNLFFYKKIAVFEFLTVFCPFHIFF